MKFLSIILGITLAVTLSSCGSVGTTIDGRVVSGKCLFFSTLRSDGQQAAINLGGTKMQVTKSNITWGKTGSLKLPGEWNRLELIETLGAIEVSVDGRRFANIEPIG